MFISNPTYNTVENIFSTYPRLKTKTLTICFASNNIIFLGCYSTSLRYNSIFNKIKIHHKFYKRYESGDYKNVQVYYSIFDNYLKFFKDHTKNFKDLFGKEINYVTDFPKESTRNYFTIFDISEKQFLELKLSFL